MFKQISATFNTYSSGLAYIYCGIDNLITRTYSELKEETRQIEHLFSEVPEGSLIAVSVGKHPCLLPIICCLLEHKIAFILLDAQNSHEYLKGNNIKLYAVVTCEVHTKQVDNSSSTLKKWCCQVTKLGCLYQLSIYNSQTIEENDPLFKYHGICYVITTSGTVGVKKLVKVTENSIFSNIKTFTKLFDITNEDVIYFGTPLSFDPCFIEIFLSLTIGACLFATSKQIRDNPHKLVKRLFSNENITSKRVTFMQMCPSVFLQFSPENIDFILFKSGLRILALGGEQFPVCIVPAQTPKTCKMYNLYGITEVSCWASVERVFYGQEVALGLPLDETQFQIETFKGEIINYSDIKSSCEIYEGVLRIGSKTRLCFIDNEETCSSNDVNTNNSLFRSTGDLVKVQNGRIFYTGRQNDVIKRFGHRVSLVKLQELVYNLTQLVNRSIIYENKVFCFLQIGMVNTNRLNEFKRKAIDKIRVKLVKSLPSEYMPDFIDIISQFPVKTSNGKVDLLCLQEIAHKLCEDSITGVKSINRELFVDMWFKYLGISESHRDSESLNFNLLNFWDSGGNSIRALQFVQEYESKSENLFNRTLLDLKLEDAINFIGKNRSNYDVGQLHMQEETNGIKIIWKAEMSACIDSPPTFCHINETGYLTVGDFAHTFSVFEETTGMLVATVDLPNVIGAACLVLQDKFYVPCFDGVLYCLKLCFPSENSNAKLQRVWSHKTNDQLKSKPTLINNNIVFGSYDGNVYTLTEGGCLMRKTSVGEPITTEVKHSGENIFVATLKCSILSILHQTHEITWRYKAHSPIFSSPEVSQEFDCVLFLDIQGNIYAFSLKNPSCSLLWTFTATSAPHPMKTFGSMTLTSDRIVLGTLNGKLVVLKFNNVNCYHEESMTLTSTSSVTTKPLVLCKDIENAQNPENYLVVVNSVGCVHLIRVREGNNEGDDDGCCLELVSNYSLPNECFSSPQINSKDTSRIYLGCRDNNLYCLEIPCKEY